MADALNLDNLSDQELLDMANQLEADIQTAEAQSSNLLQLPKVERGGSANLDTAGEKNFDAIADFMVPGLPETIGAASSQAGGAIAKKLLFKMAPKLASGPVRTALSFGARALSYVPGNVLGQVGEEATRSSLTGTTAGDMLDITESEPGIQVPNTTEAVVAAGAGALNDKINNYIKNFGGRRIERANTLLTQAAQPTLTDLRNGFVESIDGDLIPSLNDSMDAAASVGLFDGIKNLSDIVKNIPKVKQAIATQLFGDSATKTPGLIQKVNGAAPPKLVQTRLEEAYQRVQRAFFSSQSKDFLPDAESADKAERLMGFFLKDIQNAKDVNTVSKLKQRYYVDKIDYRKDIDVATQTKNRVYKKMGAELKAALEDLAETALGPSAREEMILLNQQYGAVSEVEKVFKQGLLKEAKRSFTPVQAGKALMYTTGAAIPAGALVTGGSPLQVAASAIPLMAAVGYGAAQSPSALIMRSKINRGLGEGAGWIGAQGEKLARAITQGAITSSPETQRQILGALAASIEDGVVIQQAEQILQTGDDDRIGQFFASLLADPAYADSLGQVFEPGPRGYKSYFNGKLYDQLEAFDYASFLNKQEANSYSPDPEITKELNALNKDGTVLNPSRLTSGRVQLQNTIQTPAMPIATATSRLADNIKRQAYDY